MAGTPAYLLIVNRNPALLGEIGLRLKRAGTLYRLLKASSRGSFFDCLQTKSPDLIVAEVEGVPDLSLEQILNASRRPEGPIPLLVIGERDGEQIANRASQDGVCEYLSYAELDRLPSAIERSLCEGRERGVRARLQSEIEHAASLLQENQRLITIGRLAGSIAHEINNPLEAVTNLLFLMNESPGVPPTVCTYLAQAQAELSRAIEISKQTLNFYREAPTSVPVNLSSLLDEAVVLYGRKIAQRNLEVVRKYQSEEPIVIFPGEVRQVFANLIGNAIDANINGGKLYLRVRKSRLWRDPGILGMRVTIADTGTGMTSEVRRHIGEAFYTTKGQGGTGLGLWVSQSIIRRYGGNLALRSRTGAHHGTVFSLFLPTNLRPHAVSDPLESRVAPRSSPKVEDRPDDPGTHHRAS